MDEAKDFLKEDGYLAVNDCSDINKIIFHPNLNVILIFTNSTIIILDVNSGVVLQRVAASGKGHLLSMTHEEPRSSRFCLWKFCGKLNLTKKENFPLKIFIFSHLQTSSWLHERLIVASASSISLNLINQLWLQVKLQFFNAMTNKKKIFQVPMYWVTGSSCR